MHKPKQLGHQTFVSSALEVVPEVTAVQEQAQIAPIRTVTPSLSVIVPTRNESDNVAQLTHRLAESLSGSVFSWELVFVDDSDDDTADRIKTLCDDRSPVNLVHRPKGMRRGGLSGAVIEGIPHTTGGTIIVMDGDLQHPPESVATLASSVIGGECSIAVGSRYVSNGYVRGLDGFYRRAVSQAGRLFIRLLFPKLRAVRDPLSGFFAVQRDVMTSAHLAPEGFKILLEVLIKGQWDTVKELPYEFAARQQGTSKAGWKEGIRFLRHAMRLRFDHSKGLEHGKLRPISEGSSLEG